VKTQASSAPTPAISANLSPTANRPALIAFRTRPGDPIQRSLHITVARYAQQAVLMANIEEARYRVLLTKDENPSSNRATPFATTSATSSKSLFHPAHALERFSLRQTRPPRSAPDGSLLLPLAKTRAAKTPPSSRSKSSTFSPPLPGPTRAAELSLPALDLPVSRTGLQIFFPRSSGSLPNRLVSRRVLRQSHLLGPRRVRRGAGGEHTSRVTWRRTRRCRRGWRLCDDRCRHAEV